MRRDSGFTLLEMLVALVVFGLVMAGIAQTFKFGLTAWRQGPVRTEEPEDLAALDGALTRLLSQALPGSLTGLPNQLAFTTPLPPGAGLPNALADVAILDDHGTLILRYRPHPAGILLQPPPPPKIETLAQGVSGFATAYLGPNLAGPPVWTGKWSRNTLPVLVRLHIELTDGRDWPDLIVAPIAAGN